MSSRSQPPRRGVQYGIRMVTTNKVYEEERKRRYPDTYDQNYPNERTRTDHDAYKARTTEANFATKRYEKLYAKERSDYRAYGESDPARYAEEKAHYNQLGGLFPDQHERPIEPAQERHETTLSMANGRDNYLADHPYGYKNLKERKEHEVLRGNAYNQSLEAQRDFNTHYKYAGSKLNDYGHREPRD